MIRQRRTLLISVFSLVLGLGLAAPAAAGPNAGGTLIVHGATDLVYTGDDAPYCGQSGLTSCAAALTELDTETVRVWWVFAAFPETSDPRLQGVTWGIEYSTGAPGAGEIFLVDHGNCGDFELPDGNWPASGSGNAVTWTSPQTSTLVEVYWFAGYGYYGPGSFALGPNPAQGGDFADDSVPAELDPIAGYGVLGFGQPGEVACPAEVPGEGACCFADGTCQVLPSVDCEAAGGAYQGDGTDCDSAPCPQAGACCFLDGSCEILTEDECQVSSGVYQGDGTVCDPNPCVGPEGACCFASGACEITTEADCTTLGGVYQGDDTVCEPNPCPQPAGACCFSDGTCEILTQGDCEANGGVYEGDFVDCDPNPCIQPEGACCFEDGSCTILSEAGCADGGGVYQGDGTSCDPNPCPQPSGACCFDDGSCQVLTVTDCVEAGGTYQGDATSCEPNPCEPPTPTHEVTWGRIKSSYR